MALTYLIAFVPGWAAAQLFAAAGLPVLSATFKFLSLVSSLRVPPQVCGQACDEMVVFVLIY